MGNVRYLALVAILASLTGATALPATAPLAGLHYLVGTWNCTYSAGATRLAYNATYAYDHDGHILRQIATYKGGGDEELLAYDAQHHRWTAVVLDDQGNATVMRAPGSDSSRIAYRSVYPDTSIAVTFDRTSATKYLLHGTIHLGGKTITSVDTCVRNGA
ncbi:MAG TPA: hypothetical protein VFE16_08555 [Candidatus Cybelea sp.]|jgi:hypothetical protein|nr:hypothetical protein [Candidatus Cybelea sp.]